MAKRKTEDVQADVATVVRPYVERSMPHDVEFVESLRRLCADVDLPATGLPAA